MSEGEGESRSNVAWEVACDLVWVCICDVYISVLELRLNASIVEGVLYDDRDDGGVMVVCSAVGEGAMLKCDNVWELVRVGCRGDGVAVEGVDENPLVITCTGKDEGKAVESVSV